MKQCFTIILISICLLLLYSSPTNGQNYILENRALDKVNSLVDEIKRLCTEIDECKDLIDNNELKAEKGKRDVEAYIAKPFSQMSMSKIEYLPSGYEYVKEAFLAYVDARKLLSLPFAEVEDRLKKESFALKKMNKDKMTEVQKDDIEKLCMALNNYAQCQSDFTKLVRLKNTVLIDKLEEGVILKGERWTNLRNPWDPVPIKVTDMISQFKKDYADVPFIVNWLSRYEKKLFNDKVPPFTPIPYKEFGKIAYEQRYDALIDKNFPLLEMEKQFGLY